MVFIIKKKRKIPLILRKINEEIYCQCQYEVAGDDNQLLGIYVELSKISANSSEQEIGKNICLLLERFQKYGDLYLTEIVAAQNMTWLQYNQIQKQNIYAFFDVKNDVDMLLKYQECGIVYDVNSNQYAIDFTWYNKKKRYIEFSSSIGEKNILTFATPLEFDSTITPEELGRMTLEAFDRCQQLRDAANGNKFPKKEMELLDESVLEVQMPRDKHFADSGDMGVGELYQVYEYFPKEDAEDSQAHFFLGIGAELNCDLSRENILAAWENYNGKAEYFDVQEGAHGIYSLRAELRNKTIHKISYFMPQNESLVLECSMELYQPGRRKKLEEKLVPLFEEFAKECKRK